MADSYGGPVWCMAANNAGTLLAIGCEDGCVRLFDLTDGDLLYKRSFEPQKGAVQRSSATRLLDASTSLPARFLCQCIL